MKKTKEIKSESADNNGQKSEAATNDQKESKAYKSAMKAFEMTHKRLYPELYKEKAKRG